jgi:hypothetical protein
MALALDTPANGRPSRPYAVADPQGVGDRGERRAHRADAGERAGIHDIQVELDRGHLAMYPPFEGSPSARQVVVALSIETGDHELVGAVLVVVLLVAVVWWLVKRGNRGAAIKLVLWAAGVVAFIALFSHAPV